MFIHKERKQNESSLISCGHLPHFVCMGSRIIHANCHLYQNHTPRFETSMHSFCNILTRFVQQMHKPTISISYIYESCHRNRRADLPFCYKSVLLVVINYKVCHSSRLLACMFKLFSTSFHHFLSLNFLNFASFAFTFL